MDKLLTAFLPNLLPLYKLNNSCLRDLFHLGRRLPSESTCRARVSALADTETERILASKIVDMVTPTVSSIGLTSSNFE